MSDVPEISSKISPRLVKMFTVVAVLTIGLFGSLVWYTWDTFRYLETTQKNYFRLTELSGSIVHLDEVLTMSARMAAVTGEQAWEARYRGFETKLDAAIKEAMVLGQGFSLKDAADMTDKANLKLVNMENQVFDLVRKGQTEKAATILSSTEYDRQKKIYLSGITQINETIRGNLGKNITEYRRRGYLAISSILFVTPCLVFGWILVVRLIRQYDTNRKQAEEALWKSEEKFRTIFDKASDGILIVDAVAKKFLQGNATICSMLGYTKEDIKSLTINDIHSPKDISHVLDEFEKLAKGETTLAEDLPVMRKDGSIFYADIGASPVVIGGVHCLLGIFRDITERKRAEEALRESEELFRNYVEYAPDGVYMNDMEGTFLYGNQKCEEITGYRREELIGKNFLELNILPENSLNKAVQLLQANIAGRSTGPDELELIHKEGRIIPIEINTNVVQRMDQRIVLAFVRDITNRKHAEEALQESEQRYRALVENANDIIFRTDDTGHFTLVNPAALRITGYDEKEIIGRHCATLIRSDMREEIMKILGDQFVKRIPNTYSEYPIIVKDGREIWLGQNTQLIFQDGKVVVFQAVARDITESKRIGEALQDSENRYRELSIIDELTQLYNSRHFYIQLKIELDRSNRYRQPLTLLLLDLDNFKHYNDTYGHVEGDQVLRRLGLVVKRCLRETDFAYRYGGEEFTILLPMTTSADGAVTAERIRTEFKNETFSPAPGQEVHMTVSIGLAQYQPQEEMKGFVHRVDQFMYQGKKNGKDRVCSESSF